VTDTTVYPLSPGKVECPRCSGRGEQAVPGTYGLTVSPEALETVECWLCEGDGEVTPLIAADWRSGELHDEED
jgi:hypothetical protein